MSVLQSAYQNYLSYLNASSSELPSVWFYNRNNSNLYWESGFQDAVAAFWPMAGMRQGRHASGRWVGGQLKYAGTSDRMGYGYYWTSTPWDAAGNVVVPGASYNVTMREHILYEISYGPNADAYPVRCVKIDTP
jgi:hypothetical protein